MRTVMFLFGTFLLPGKSGYFLHVFCGCVVGHAAPFVHFIQTLVETFPAKKA